MPAPVLSRCSVCVIVSNHHKNPMMLQWEVATATRALGEMLCICFCPLTPDTAGLAPHRLRASVQLISNIRLVLLPGPVIVCELIQVCLWWHLSYWAHGRMTTKSKLKTLEHKWSLVYKLISDLVLLRWGLKVTWVMFHFSFCSSTPIISKQ